MATDGVVVLQSLTDNLIGEIHAAKFQHVNVNPSTYVSTPHPDGCTAEPRHARSRSPFPKSAQR